MRRVIAKMVVGCIVGSSASVGASGCADNESSLFILGVAKVGSECTYAPSGGDVMLTRGVYDAGFRRSYQAGLVVGNQMRARGEKARSRTETSRVILEGAEVSLTLSTGEAFMEPFSAPGAGFVDVASGDGAGYGVLSVVLLPRPETDEEVELAVSAGYVIAEVKAFGRTLGGQEVESGGFKFPIEICYGCLVSFGASEMGVDENNEEVCRESVSTEEAAVPCSWGQDDMVSCSSCAAAFEVCKRPP